MGHSSVMRRGRRHSRPLRVLVIFGSIHWREDEGSEVREQVAGVTEAIKPGELELRITDCRSVFRAAVTHGELHLEHAQSLVRQWLIGADVVHACIGLPDISLIVAFAFRLRGAKVILSPMTFLGEDFAQRSWTHERSKLWTRLKPGAVRVTRGLWRTVAHLFVCLSHEEIRLAHLPAERCMMAPWPKPDTPLLQEAAVADSPEAPEDAPIAFVSRMDPWRKGIDRMCAWLRVHESSLPRPAVLLLAPDETGTPEEVRKLAAAGLIDWDTTTRGAALIERLAQTRGVMLLSRFDGQPRSLREAACLGLPTLCTRSSHFEEVVSVLGRGVIVDGDDPADIHRGFEALAAIERDPGPASVLFDRRRIGCFLTQIYLDVGSGKRPKESDFYGLVARSPMAS